MSRKLSCCNMTQLRAHSLRTISNLIRLSPLLIDEDDGDQDDDLSHNAQEGPEGGQAAADTQVDLVGGGAKFAGSGTDVISHVLIHV